MIAEKTYADVCIIVQVIQTMLNWKLKLQSALGTAVVAFEYRPFDLDLLFPPLSYSRMLKNAYLRQPYYQHNCRNGKYNCVSDVAAAVVVYGGSDAGFDSGVGVAVPE